ncbi:inositol-tetrakisphosphate 1-kinase 6-like [Zingiber officinale]|uniref:inositol-tetrakisphosphate 1-kinase 6-like n=1 Tax=Zingiber officinale TaxID=94328 RepID=UPI001C4B54A0|nr:inositol-tetrakisphosphate 1-kinase 6-like [Zingiber officinale]
MGAVRGVLLDESVLLSDDGDDGPLLKPGAEAVLRRLRYSDLRVGFCHDGEVSAQKAAFLQKTARMHSYTCISLTAPDIINSFNQVLLEWGIAGDGCFYVTSKKHEAAAYEIVGQSWVIVHIGVDCCYTTNNEFLFIEKLEQLPLAICCFTKKALKNLSLLIIGYLMKPSREEDFAKRGAFPMYPPKNRLMFVPLSFEFPLESQLQVVDAVLHKATDEIINFKPNTSTEFSEGVSFSTGMRELERFIKDHPECCLIDPLKNIYPLLDRHQIQQILLGLQEINMQDHCRLRAPYFLKIDAFNEPNLRDQLSEANLSFPIIVKPQIACGVGDAHNMALVFKFEDFKGLHVPLPAILQEYLDHGSLIYKFYVLGTNVFHAVKKSMPNASFLVSSQEKNGLKPITFDSLKSLPVATDDQFSVDRLKGGKELDVDLVNSAASWLKIKLDLTIFGFDLVIQEDSGDHVIVDLNYLPSFKEVPNADAIPAFWTAIRSSYESRKTN